MWGLPWLLEAGTDVGALGACFCATQTDVPAHCAADGLSRCRQAGFQPGAGGRRERAGARLQGARAGKQAWLGRDLAAPLLSKI